MKKQLIKTALEQRLPDLLLRNGRVVNVFTGEIIHADVAVAEGHIAAVGNYEAGKQVVDLCGRYVVPGFIDAHCHVESSMATPDVYARLAARWGTTTLITDPHEIANVAGAEGIRFMLDSARGLPVNYYVQLPSCVPATPFEHAGAVLGARELRPFLSDPNVLGLGEMMNYPGVAACDLEVMEKLSLFSDRVIDGHAPGILGNDLQAYAAAGIQTDHESVSFAEALEKLRAGIAVLVREGSASKNLDAILSGVLESGIDTRFLAFCTDDKHLSDIRTEGTIRHNVQRAIALGINPVAAIQMATINPARIYGLHDIGAVAAGYKADLLVLEDLSEVHVSTVYKDGVLLTDKQLQQGTAEKQNPRILHTVNLPALEAGCFALPQKEQYAVINLVANNIVTRKTECSAKEANAGLADGTLRKIAVVERHHATGNIGVGLLAGYGLRHGAIATSVAHDSHNIIVAGDNDADMLAAVRELERVQGGYTLVRDGVAIGTLPLPIGGLMSDLPADELIESLDRMLLLAREAGVSAQIDPFLTLSFMALPVIPEIRITDMGVFDVASFSFV